MKSASVGTVILGLLIGAIIAALLGGWGLMLAVGVIHIHWIAALPLLGYWNAVRVAVAVYFARICLFSKVSND